ncbi:MAG: hypothetical protein R3E96_12090 [Planctomycetota bacterium]
MDCRTCRCSPAAACSSWWTAPAPARCSSTCPSPRSNHLLALDRDFEGGFVAAWARASEGLRVGKGDWMPDGPEGQWEWQPGPVLVDGELWVLGRSLPPAAGSDAEAAPAEAFVELFAFDTVEGHQRHRMTLHKAADLAGRDPAPWRGHSDLVHAARARCRQRPGARVQQSRPVRTVPKRPTAAGV